MAPVFGDEAGRRLLAGIALGNEPDLTYSADLARYLGEFPAYSGAEHVNAWPRLIPATSENIGTWQSIRDRTINTRWFWNWPDDPRQRRSGDQGQARRPRTVRD